LDTFGIDDAINLRESVSTILGPAEDRLGYALPVTRTDVAAGPVITTLPRQPRPLPSVAARERP